MGDIICSFCGEKDVTDVITGPSANICGSCVSICCDLISEGWAKKRDGLKVSFQGSDSGKDCKPKPTTGETNEKDADEERSP